MRPSEQSGAQLGSWVEDAPLEQRIGEPHRGVLTLAGGPGLSHPDRPLALRRSEASRADLAGLICSSQHLDDGGGCGDDDEGALAGRSSRIGVTSRRRVRRGWRCGRIASRPGRRSRRASGTNDPWQARTDQANVGLSPGEGAGMGAERRNRVTRRIGGAVAATTAIAAVVAVETEPASASSTNCKSGSGTNPTLDYWVSPTVTDYFADATVAADNTWDSFPGLPGNFVGWYTSFPSPADEFLVSKTDQGASGPLAYVNSPGSGSIVWGSDGRCKMPLHIHYNSNSSQMGSLSYDEKRVVAIHEFGHIFSLGHNNTTGCNQNDAGLMYYAPLLKYDECGWSSPTADDREGVYDLY